MFARILVPLDGSPLAEAILPEVVDLATLHGAEVLLLRVALVHALPGVDQTEHTLHGRVERTLRFLPCAKTAVVAGPPFRQIIRYAREHHVDLIVMGTQGLSGLDRLIMGSTAERVVRTAPCPVVSIRAAA